MARANSIYQQAVSISTDYLGPAGERFMRRQIITHLDKRPEDLTKSDVTELVHWIRLTVALLTSDSAIIESFAGRLVQLAGKDTTQARDTIRAAK